jgi:hypothetical protein
MWLLAIKEVSMRNVIIHYHIFKNAGSTLDTILKQNFAGNTGLIEGPFAWSTLSPGEIAHYLRENKNLIAVSSHQARLPSPQCAGIQFYPLLFIRHPIDRLESIYEFDRRQPNENLPARMAKQHDLAGYLAWRLRHNNGAIIRNFQTIHLAARELDMRTACANAHDLQFAKARLSELPCFGIVDRFDESINIIANYLKPTFGELSWNGAIENRSSSRKETLAERLQDTKNMLGEAFYAKILALNTLDMELYRYANELFSAAL